MQMAEVIVLVLGRLRLGWMDATQQGMGDRNEWSALLHM